MKKLIINIDLAIDRVKKIINSCVIEEHISVASQYIDLIYKHGNNEDLRNYFTKELYKREEEIIFPLANKIERIEK